MSSSSNDRTLVCLVAAVRLAFPLFISGIFTGLTYFGCTNPRELRVSAVFAAGSAVTGIIFFLETNDLNGKNSDILVFNGLCAVL
jgi:hypothetical protein